MNALTVPIHRWILRTRFAKSAYVHRQLSSITAAATIITQPSNQYHVTNTYQQSFAPIISQQCNGYSSSSYHLKCLLSTFGLFATFNVNDSNKTQCAPTKRPPPDNPTLSNATKRFRSLKPLNPDDPLDNAFKMMTEYNVPLELAIKHVEDADENTKRSLRARVQRYHERQLISDTPKQTTAAAPSITPASRTSKKMKVKELTSLDKARAAGVQQLPGYLDQSKTSKQMTKRKRRSKTQVNQDHWDDNCMKKMYANRYSLAWKKATITLHDNMFNPNTRGKKGYGARAVAENINKTLLTSPNDKKISRNPLHQAVAVRKEVGLSPPIQGKPPKVPKELTKALALQTVMMQVSGEGEAASSNMIATADALTIGTEHEGKVSTDYLWRKSRKEYPEIFNPVMQKNHGDRRADFLTYKNIKDWTKHAKKFLIDIGMAEDKPGLIPDGVESEISLIHPDDINWFFTLDETHHEFSTKGDKGGSRATRYATVSFPRPGDRTVKNSTHTTGVYGYTYGGEPLPPLYILSSKAANEDNYKYDPSIGEGLPIVTAKYANDRYKTHPSRVAVRSKGSMELTLWEQLITDVYLPCYPGKFSPIPIRDPITKKLISGPGIMKTDAGPARLAREAKSVEFREYLASMGFHIMLSLPNGTECTAELDQIFATFKPECRISTRRVAGMKMWLRVQARNKATANAAPVELTNAEQLAGYVAVNDSDDEDEDTGDDQYTSMVGTSVCNVSLDNRDLGPIVNGMPGDEIKKRHLTITLTSPRSSIH